MTLNKKDFNYIKKMINNKESLNYLKAFCKGLGIDIENNSSSLRISDNKISITYRRINYYVSYNHSKIHGTTYFNTLK
tara:strand:- start:613 stop:846 length:234 start_codon:yes stop_codon:yes gene_type:complete